MSINNNPIIKPVAFITILTLSLLALDFGIKYVLKQSTVGSIAKVTAVMEHLIDHEMTIWGASTARVHFNAWRISKELDVDCFNMGMDGTPMDQYSGLLKEYISYSRKSKVLVLVIDINGLGSRRSLYQGYAWLHHLGNENIFAAVDRIDHRLAILARYIPLYYVTQYDRRFLARAIKSIYSRSNEIDELSNWGFHPNRTLWQESGQSRFNSNGFAVEVHERVVGEIGVIIKLAKSTGTNVVIVIPPCFVNAMGLIKNMQEFECAIYSFQGGGVTVLNYLRHPISSDRQLFVNNTHLNDKGAERLTSLFIEDVRSFLRQSD